MSFVRYLGCAIALLLFAAPAASESETVFYGRGSPLVAGCRAVMAADYARGARLLERALRGTLSTSERPVALANLCAAHLGLTLHASAIESCSNAIEEEARDWRSLSNRGAAYLASGRPELAVGDFRRALEISPSARSPRIGLRKLERQQPIVPQQREAWYLPRESVLENSDPRFQDLLRRTNYPEPS